MESKDVYRRDLPVAFLFGVPDHVHLERTIITFPRLPLAWPLNAIPVPVMGRSYVQVRMTSSSPWSIYLYLLIVHGLLGPMVESKCVQQIGRMDVGTLERTAGLTAGT